MKSNRFSLITTFIFIFINTILVVLGAFILPLTISLSIWASTGFNADGQQTLGIGLLGVIIGWILSPLSLIPSFFICMKLAKWLREKKGWPIYHPRKLFALSVLAPIILVLLLVVINTVMN